jgi:hypothetical protein
LSGDNGEVWVANAFGNNNVFEDEASGSTELAEVLPDVAFRWRLETLSRQRSRDDEGLPARNSPFSFIPAAPSLTKAGGRLFYGIVASIALYPRSISPERLDRRIPRSHGAVVTSKDNVAEYRIDI